MVADDDSIEGVLQDVLDEAGGDPASAFVVDVEGFEGPIDVLLVLARNQKVDLTQISILELADQYLVFVAKARSVNLELAADYLVMAAWLAYLKSRLLLPEEKGEDEPSGEELAAALAFQLKRLQAMQDAGAALFARKRLGQDFFRRGDPERFIAPVKTIYSAKLYDLLKAYADHKTREITRTPLHVEAWELYTVDAALERLQGLIGANADWTQLFRFLPENLKSDMAFRSALASTFGASLELAKQGHIRIRQEETFGPIFIRPGSNGAAGPNQDTDQQDAANTP